MQKLWTFIDKPLARVATGFTVVLAVVAVVRDPLGWWSQQTGAVSLPDTSAETTTPAIQRIGPNFDIDSAVGSASDRTSWQKSITVAPGDEVQVKTEVKNTGTMQLDNIVVRAALPADTTGGQRAYIANSATKGKWSLVGSPERTAHLFADGMNIGSYAMSGNLYVKFVVRSTTRECAVEHVYVTAESDYGKKIDFVEIRTNGHGC